jgi:hypothetical protein
MLANHWSLLAKYGNFKRRKLKICPNPLNFFAISKLFSSKCGDFLGIF